MQIPVVIEPTPTGDFRAHAPQPLTSVGEGPTSEAALAKLREELEKELKRGKQIVLMDFPGEQENPWVAMAGSLKDNPLFDEWQAAIREFRDQVNREEGIEVD
jgi:predicted RNase H-like HicB family nuclease